MIKKIWLSIFVFLSIQTYAQTNLLLANFGIQQVNNKILVSWEINAGNQCLGLKIEHAADSISFISIYDFQGICGAGSANEKYDYLHVQPFENSKNYYRLNLGGGAYSKIESIDFVKIESEGYSLFPNPINSNSKLFFANNNNPYALSIYRSDGALIVNKNDIVDSEFDLSSFIFLKGIYFFKITNNITNFQTVGKFLVL